MSCNPVILIPGIGQSKLIVTDENGNKIKDAWPFELDEKALMNDLKGALMKMLIFRKDGGFSDKVAGIVQDISDPLAVNPDGSKKHRVRPVSFPKSVAECSEGEKKYIYKMIPFEELGEKIGEENLFFFAFDPFGDLYDTASSLDEFVAFVKKKTGSEQVNLVAVSVGGVVLKAYWQQYGDKNDVDKVLNVVSALDGTQLVADIFESKLALGDPASLLTSLGGKAASLASSIGMLPAEIIQTTIEKSLAVLKNNLVNSCTSMWGLIPNDRFDAIFGSFFADGGNDILRVKVQSLHEYSLLFADKMKGKNFYQLCGFGKPLVPVAESADTCSDGVVDTASASFGATCTGVTQRPDVSTCAFPDTTWFFEGQGHDAIAYNDVALSLAVKILTGEIESVRQSPEYPQLNGTRNIKKLKYTLIPQAKEALGQANGAEKDELEACLAEYEAIGKRTVIENDDDVKSLEARLEAALQAAKE